MDTQGVDIAPLRVSREEALRMMQDLRAEFPARSYDLVSRNCNHFSDAACRRLCGSGIPSWVNRLAGIGDAVRSAVPSAFSGTALAAPSGGAGGAAIAEGAGGPAAAGLVKRDAPSDGDLSGEVEWASVGILNTDEADPAEALRCQKQVSSESDGSPELLIFFPFVSPVKLQKLQLEAPNAACAPQRLRLFANKPDLDMDDGSGGSVATQEFENLAWTPLSLGDDPTVTLTVEVNFLRFQNLGFLSVYLGRSADDENETAISIKKIALTGRT
eukprot:TRINITY_DN11881_c0_g1_i3.p1 TRINITY_DN11881_c0_g1~~TRINITY_DN11881_c0_g1_i3.p1  ORF type:complete len:272 (+),score=54.03 TRINITY_DN11881_c0_g1_i3:304-1119(+)